MLLVTLKNPTVHLLINPSLMSAIGWKTHWGPKGVQSCLGLGLCMQSPKTRKMWVGQILLYRPIGLMNLWGNAGRDEILSGPGLEPLMAWNSSSCVNSVVIRVYASRGKVWDCNGLLHLFSSSGRCSVSMSHNHRVRQGSPATCRSESLSVCTGIDNAKYSCWANP